MKKAIFMAICLLIVFIAASYFINKQFDTSNPDNKENAAASKEIEGFYTEFSKENMGSNITFHINKTLANIELYRFYYGEIRQYRIVSIKNLEADYKQAEIEVKTLKKGGGEKTYKDTLIVVRKGDRWLVDKYYSTSVNDWPKLP
ncbi:hypothetical protein GK047_25905 [Paenibacillus sp. SYP-B3998]|uniref:DUF4878 domain-containing protein n=1 Tax=Paenibacillus sp. SYP-B3998 TaxID=2678564 RepID=A0A6G4A4J0_9BACL|nr:hypothetical protein [Paenibacillus sp. SYP-B3998]NEW09383.1 hypothetical protein [Paenibacillus sp. SYP-B3998]